jgi:benzoate-CoA ligase family protein
MLSDSRARLAIVDASLLQVVAQVAPVTLQATFASEEFERAAAAASPELDAYPTGADEPCYWLYSSGTTGQPKAVVHLHADMLACVTPYAREVLALEPEDSTFSVARLFFSYGLVNSLFLPLMAGASAVLTPSRPDAQHVVEVVRACQPTLFFSVPTSYAQLCASADADAFASVRLAVSAGEPLPPPLLERWRQLTGIDILDGLGSTEVGYIFCSNTPGSARPGSSGRMLGDHAARIVDEDGADVRDGTSGELWVRARSTALHYWNQRDRTRRTFLGEWLRTGDRYVRDVDGFFWYQGRTDDVFKVSGQWVSPLQVESCLLEHPAVLECAVVGVLDDTGLVKPKAYVVRRRDADSDLEVGVEELQSLAKQRLLPHAYPRWVEFVDELPKTSTGKVQRFRLRSM